MDIKAWDKEIKGVSNATVELKNGDHISIAYTTPWGQTNIITVSAQHLVLIARHEGTDKSVICRPDGVHAVD